MRYIFEKEVIFNNVIIQVIILVRLLKISYGKWIWEVGGHYNGVRQLK